MLDRPAAAALWPRGGGGGGAAKASEDAWRRLAGGGDDGEEDDDDEEEEDEEEEEEGVGVGGRGRGGRGRRGGDGEGSSWVACDACGKWRELPSGSGKLPPMWYCHLHPVAAYASCDVPEALYEDDEMLSWDYGMTDRDVGVDPMGSFEAMEAEALAEAEAEAAAMAAAEAKKGRGGGGRAAAAAAGGGGGGGKGKAKASGSGGNGNGGGAANGGFVGSSAETRFLEEIKEELQIREPLTYIAAAHDLLSSPQVVYQAHTRTLRPTHPPHPSPSHPSLSHHLPLTLSLSLSLSLSLQVGFEALCAAHKITFSRGVFDAIVSIMKRIALHKPPGTHTYTHTQPHSTAITQPPHSHHTATTATTATPPSRSSLHPPFTTTDAALNLQNPDDSALVGNLRLFLQIGTAQGGMSSRCALMPNTIAVAVEMVRDETLNVFAACLRHGFKMSDFGRSFNAHILERVTACKGHITDLDLITKWGDLTRPIDRGMVTEVQNICKVAVADAAAAVATHGSKGVDAACERVRFTLGLPPPADDLVAEREPQTPTSDVKLRKLQAMLKRGSCPPSLKSLQVAVHLCSDQTEEEEELTFAAHGVDKKEARPRILAYRDRIQEMKLLERLEEEEEGGGEGGEGVVGRLPPPTAMALLPLPPPPPPPLYAAATKPATPPHPTLTRQSLSRQAPVTYRRAPPHAARR